jgi:hypothetical protein
MIPPDTLNSSRSPTLMPARRLTLGGTTKPAVLLLTVTVTEFVVGGLYSQCNTPRRQKPATVQAQSSMGSLERTGVRRAARLKIFRQPRLRIA